MTDVSATRKNLWWSLWIAVRFLIFGVGGFIAVYISWLSFLFMFDKDRSLSPYVGAPLGIAGALSMLFGSGQWGRWHYLWVFLSMPITFAGMFLVAVRFPDSRFLASMWAKPVLLIWISASMPVSYLIVKNYYRRKELLSHKMQVSNSQSEAQRP